MRTEYNRVFSIRVKARANYRCEKCGSTELVQAHAPNGDHSDWTKGIALCAEHHSQEHPNLPKALFFVAKVQQPCWPNISASTLAQEKGCHSRTIIRTARKLGISFGLNLSEEDKTRIIKYSVDTNERRVMKMGGSLIVTLPKVFTTEYNIKKGDEVMLIYEDILVVKAIPADVARIKEEAR